MKKYTREKDVQEKENEKKLEFQVCQTKYWAGNFIGFDEDI